MSFFPSFFADLKKRRFVQPEDITILDKLNQQNDWKNKILLVTESSIF